MTWSEREQQLADARENAAILGAFAGRFRLILTPPSSGSSGGTVSGPGAAPVFGGSDSTLTSEYAPGSRDAGLASPQASNPRHRPSLSPKAVTVLLTVAYIALAAALAWRVLGR